MQKWFPETIFFFQKILQIGKRVTIEPYVVIGEKVVIKKNNVKINSFSHIENAKIDNNVVIGSKCKT